MCYICHVYIKGFNLHQIILYSFIPNQIKSESKFLLVKVGEKFNDLMPFCV
jgi:hypothetical protein